MWEAHELLNLLNKQLTELNSSFSQLTFFLFSPVLSLTLLSNLPLSLSSPPFSLSSLWFLFIYISIQINLNLRRIQGFLWFLFTWWFTNLLNGSASFSTKSNCFFQLSSKLGGYLGFIRVFYFAVFKYFNK